MTRLSVVVLLLLGTVSAAAAPASPVTPTADETIYAPAPVDTGNGKLPFDGAHSPG